MSSGVPKDDPARKKVLRYFLVDPKTFVVLNKENTTKPKRKTFRSFRNIFETLANASAKRGKA